MRCLLLGLSLSACSLPEGDWESPHAEWVLTGATVECEGPDRISVDDLMITCTWWCVEGQDGGMVWKDVTFTYDRTGIWQQTYVSEYEDWCQEW
jgi:hypothetical protein